MLENIDGDLPQPIVDLATVDVRRFAVALDPFRRRRLGGHGDLRAAPEEMDRFYFARQQRRLYAALGGALNDRRDADKIGVLHVIGFAGAAR